ncbi:hypothetical protein H4R20_002372 [Coemansia guatemalensis]|uniref:TPR-like protein n=1 Tax=Coemansia guatemalensis TaxID=2761395 RepID=A0A9W8LU13_9FUNG|nr:hypothetical protein H4R20_002372 [Coemansia guatemalensis]
MTLSQVERRTILGQSIPDSAGEGEGSTKLAKLLVEGSYAEILQSSTAKAIFGADLDSGASIQASDAPSPFAGDFSASDIGPFVTSLVKQYVERGPEGLLQIVVVGAACLNAFIQTNWTGPELRLDPAALLPKALAERWKESFISTTPLELPEDASKHEIGRREQMGRVYLGAKQSDERAELDRTLVRMMEVDGEEAYALVPRPLYLHLARLLLVDIPTTNDELLQQYDAAAPSAHWWAARTLSIQQSLLDYPTQTLLDQITDHFAKLRQHMPESPAQKILESSISADSEVQVVPDEEIGKISAKAEDTLIEEGAAGGSLDTAGEDGDNDAVPEDRSVDDDQWGPVSVANRELWARYLLELGVVYSQHKMPLDAKRHLSLAQAASGLQWKMTGAKGRRTRFQTFDVTQLVLLAKSAQRVDSEHNPIPEALELNDDTLLENIQFTDPSDELDRQEDLQTIDKCILLALCLNVQNENPAHGLTSEQMMPFVVRVLQHTGNWSVYTMGLLLRSRLESAKSRTVERATLQMQTLVDQITHPLPNTTEAGAAERLRYLPALSLPSQWELERELADMFMELGVVRSSLDIYERLQMWDEVISCYTLLGQKEVAERIVRREIELNPDRPKLWCVLGDLKCDPEHWRHAWEVSGQRYARAMRSLGAYHFGKNEYAASAECYEKAVSLNPLFEKSWYILGCAAMHIGNWQLAIKSFLHVVSIDENNGESWNNLATVYLRLGKDYQIRALHALREAIKFKHESWQVWSNFLHVSLGLGLLSQSIQAMGRVVDLRAAKDGAGCVDLDSLRSMIGMMSHGVAFQGLSSADAERKERKLTAQMEALLVGKIEARITNSASLWRVMADYWFWRRDFRHCLDNHIKAYRCVSQLPQVSYAPPVFNDAVDAAMTLLEVYENLGDKTQVIRVPTTDSGDQMLPDRDAATAAADLPERKTSAVEQPVCADWRRQSKMLLRGLIGKGKESFEGTPSYTRLTEALQELRKE